LQKWRDFIGWSLGQPALPDISDTLDQLWPRGPAFVMHDLRAGAIVNVMQLGEPTRFQEATVFELSDR
jgi:hypothetical protein